MTWVGVSSFLPPPIWNTENEQGWQVSHCASAAEIFIGWYFASMIPRWLPTIRARMETGSSTTIASFGRAAEQLAVLVRRSCHADTASITHGPGHQRGQHTWA